MDQLGWNWIVALQFADSSDSDRYGHRLGECLCPYLFIFETKIGHVRHLSVLSIYVSTFLTNLSFPPKKVPRILQNSVEANPCS